MASSTPGRAQHELGEVRRALAAERRERLADLEGIPDRATEGLVHRSQLADDAAAGALPEVEHGLGKQSSPLGVFMNAPSPTFTSRRIAPAPAAIFFDMMLAAISETSSTVAVTSRSA